jgi:tetratricopeptide (TPR) repeat protein
MRQLENPALAPNQRAELRCEAARDFEEKGDYEAAREAMGELWQRVGEMPNVEGLEASTAAEVLLRAGTLTGWLGSCNQIEGAQETAKNVISESIRVFKSLSYTKKILEAQTELAYCYFRQGEYNEARIILEGVLESLTTDSELKAKAVLRLAIVEWGAARYSVSLKILTDSAALFDKINSHAVKGGYHNQLAVVLRTIATSEQRADYLDRAFIEYAAASFHFEQAGHKRYLANVENNLGFLFYEVSKHTEAHEHLDRARRLTVSLKDKVHTARVDETRARVFLAQGQTEEAEKTARVAVRTLESGGQQGILSEALITHGRALARLKHYDQSRFTFLRAIETARQAGAIKRAGEAALAMVEELGEHLTVGVMTKATATECVLGDELKRYEAELIRQALRRASGSVTRAAHLLGITHQYLCYLLDNRHPELLTERTPIVRRRRGIIKKP